MPIVFIAVQCYRCSTMQVKQQKKSSNKWICVVCNEKQSVQKVYTRASMAKDVRKFVQSFNMSRRFAEQESLLTPKSEEDEEGGEEKEQVVEIDPIKRKMKKKRTDWSEYIDDPYKKVENENNSGDGLEENVVTELPKPLFKKPTLKKNYAFAGCEYDKKGYRPIFGKRNADQKIKATRKEPNTEGESMVKGSSQWSVIRKQAGYHFADNELSRHRYSTAIGESKYVDHIDGDEDGIDENFAYKVIQGSSANAKTASKWHAFLDDEEDLQARCPKDLGEHIDQWSDDVVFDKIVDGERVEDDIHPDFQ